MFRAAFAPIIVLLLVLLTATEGPALLSRFLGKPDAEEIFGRDPKVNIKYYSVSGNSITEIEDAIRKNGPLDAGGKKRRYAYVDWFIFWDWPKETDGSPALARTTSDYKIDVLLPKWEPSYSASPETVESWNNLLNALIYHEKGHIDFARLHVNEVANAIVNAAIQDPKLSIEEASKIGKAEVAKIKELDIAYDRETKHGLTQGVELSKSSSIETNYLVDAR